MVRLVQRSASLLRSCLNQRGVCDTLFSVIWVVRRCSPRVHCQRVAKSFAHSVETGFPCVMRIAALQEIKMACSRESLEESLYEAPHILAAKILYELESSAAALLRNCDVAVSSAFNADHTASQRFIKAAKALSEDIDALVLEAVIEELLEASSDSDTDVLSDCMCRTPLAALDIDADGEAGAPCQCIQHMIQEVAGGIRLEAGIGVGRDLHGDVDLFGCLRDLKILSIILLNCK